MPHADSAYIPEDIKTKEQFYEHVSEQLVALLEGSRYWVSNLAQASALLASSFLSSPLYGYAEPSDANGSSSSPKVNWVGFYLLPPHHAPSTKPGAPLLLGPYVGRPACIIIPTQAGKGVCADAYVGDETVMVADVEAYPGHIGEPYPSNDIDVDVRPYTVDSLSSDKACDESFDATSYPTGTLTVVACDGDTRSEIVVPLRTPTKTIGVLDLDSVAHGTFDGADKKGLERIAEILRDACDWE